MGAFPGSGGRALVVLVAICALVDVSLVWGQVSLHPTSFGSINGFDSASGCGANHWDCVNDPPGNDGVGPAVANDGLASYLQDNNGSTHREMFALDDGTVPSGSSITEITIHAQLGVSNYPLLP